MSDEEVCHADPPKRGSTKMYFKDLLQQLADSHEEQVSALTLENESVKLENVSLRRQLSTDRHDGAHAGHEEQIDTEHCTNKPYSTRTLSTFTPRRDSAATTEVVSLQNMGTAAASSTSVYCSERSSTNYLLELDGAPDVEIVHCNSIESLGSSAIEKTKQFGLFSYWCDDLQMTSSKWMKPLANVSPFHLDTVSAADEHVEEYEGCMHIIAPSSHYRLGWDIAGMILIFYDIVTIPMGVFSKQEEVVFKIGDWTTQLFWTADMFASCVTGYVEHGNTIMHPRKIVKKYFQTWFFIDVLVVGLDWFVTVLSFFGASDEASGGAADLVKLIRILRVVRILRLLRLAKLRRIINQIYDHINSEHASIIMNIIKLVAFLLIVNHIIACCWFLVSDSHEGNNCWVKFYKFKEVTWHYQYLTSLHWSLTQFTPASMHIQPQNSFERTIALFIIILALLMFSSVVGSITGSMTQLRALRENEWKQFWLLRRYLRQQKVPTNLSVRIQRYLEYACSNRKEVVPPSAVNILSLLSDQLKDELECAIVLPSVIVHNLFRYMEEYYAVTLNRLARHAITRKLLARYDSLFYPTDIALGMYFLICGDLTYAKASISNGRPDEYTDTNEHCFSEPALWSPRWEHVGEVKAQSECDVIAIVPSRFAEIITSNPALLVNVQTYAKSYVLWLSSIDVDSLSDLWPAAKSEKHMTSIRLEIEADCRQSQPRSRLLKSVKHQISQTKTRWNFPSRGSAE